MSGVGPEAVDVATGGRPEEALAAVTSERWSEPGGLYSVSVAHDDGCPCITGRPMRFCTCEVVRVTGRRVA